MSQDGNTIATWEDESLHALLDTGNPDGFNRQFTYNSNVKPARFPVRTQRTNEAREVEESFVEQSVWQPSYNYGVGNAVVEPAWSNIAMNVAVVVGVVGLLGGAVSLLEGVGF